MFTPHIETKVVEDKAKQIEKTFSDLKNIDVLVGIPQEKSSREGGDEMMTNAELAFIHTNGVRSASMRQEMETSIAQGHSYQDAHQMYIHSHGSPLYRVPPRPIIEPAIEDDKEILSQLLGEAAKALLEGRTTDAEQYLEKAGLEGQGVAQDWFDNPKNNWPPNAPSTQEEKRKKGSTDPKPLIDTGELRRSITYVIREKR